MEKHHVTMACVVETFFSGCFLTAHIHQSLRHTGVLLTCAMLASVAGGVHERCGGFPASSEGEGVYFGLVWGQGILSGLGLAAHRVPMFLFLLSLPASRLTVLLASRCTARVAASVWRRACGRWNGR